MKTNKAIEAKKLHYQIYEEFTNSDTISHKDLAEKYGFTTWHIADIISKTRKELNGCRKYVSPEIASRNNTIYKEWFEGASIEALASKYALSTGYVSQIISHQRPDITKNKRTVYFEPDKPKKFVRPKAVYDNTGYLSLLNKYAS